MPSFDIVSRTDMAEVDNAVQGAAREIATRYDFKGSNCSYERTDQYLIRRASHVYVQIQSWRSVLLSDTAAPDPMLASMITAT